MTATASLLAGSVRTAEPRDRDEVARLLDETRITTPSLHSSERAHVLVLDVEGCLRGATYVVMDERCTRAHILVLVEATELGAPAIEERLLGVSRAVCEAYGCTRIDVASSSRGYVRESFASLALDDNLTSSMRRLRA